VTLPHISVVTPVYRCCDSLRELYSRLAATLAAISEDFEIIMVNDGSPDEAWRIIQQLAIEDPRVKGINLSRNFGQHYAITAGLDCARGDWVVVMDCDLQDVPEEIPKLYRKACEGFDLVVGRRARRQDAFLKKMCSRLFYWIFAYLTGSAIDNRIGNFGVYSKKVIRSISVLKEQNRSFGLFALWVGFRRVEIDIEHARRPRGKSSYTFARMMSLAVDSIIAHSNRLLHISIKLGFALSLSSLLYAFWLVVEYFVWAKPLAGWTSLMVSIYFTAGLIIGSIGVVGLYVGKIFDEMKGRPLYIIDSTTFEMRSEND
jgi:dolichol-phosphate mannosyltransferase